MKATIQLMRSTFTSSPSLTSHTHHSQAKSSPLLHLTSLAFNLHPLSLHHTQHLLNTHAHHTSAPSNLLTSTYNSLSSLFIMSDNDQSGTNTSGPQFSEREQQLLCWAMQSLKSGAPEVRLTIHRLNPLKAQLTSTG